MLVARGRTWQAKKINGRSTFAWPAKNNNNNNNNNNNKKAIYIYIYIYIHIFRLSPGLICLKYGLIRI